MFDSEKYMRDREIIRPIDTPDPAAFPHSEELPEGCHLLKGLRDEWGYQVDIHTDVVYAERDGRQLHLIILEPKAGPHAEGTWPCIAYVQGSAFHEQWLWNHISWHIRMAERGFAVAVIEYRPSELAPFPAQTEDALTAIRYLKMHAAEYHIDSERMAVMGDSSGGHTALMAGFTGDGPAQVKCIVDLYGPTVFSLMNYYPSSQDHIGPDSPEGYEIGQKNVLEHPELAEKTIPMNYLSRDRFTPPTLIIHGGRDMLVPFNQSVQLYNYMRSMGKDVTFYKIDDANHGFLGFDNDTVLGIVVDFLRKQLH